jgi:hypothetical protein
VARNKWTKFVTCRRGEARSGNQENTANSRAETFSPRSALLADCITQGNVEERMFATLSGAMFYSKPIAYGRIRVLLISSVNPNWHVSESFAEEAARAVDE